MFILHCKYMSRHKGNTCTVKRNPSTAQSGLKRYQLWIITSISTKTDQTVGQFSNLKDKFGDPLDFSYRQQIKR